MADNSSEKTDTGFSRRTVLAGLGSTTAAVSLSGCAGDDDVDGDLGERVPELDVSYWTAGLRTPELELLIPIVEENIEERLGVEVNIQPVDLTTSLGELASDARSTDLAAGYAVLTPEQFDPNDDLNDYSIYNAGGQGATNYSQYASCEFTELYEEQLRASTEEERREAVHGAMHQMAEDKMLISIMNTVTFGLTNSNRVNTRSEGLGGNGFGNPRFYINSEPIEGNTLRAYALPGIAESPNFITNPLPTQLVPWTQLLHSPLLQYDENFELRNCLADTFEVDDGSQQFTIELIEHEFHNGDPVTSSDVAFTIDHIHGNADQFPQANPLPEYEIDIIDDQSLEINFESPILKFQTADVPMWGILHEDTWVEAGAPENPRNPDLDPEDLVGSGPFELAGFNQGVDIEMAPTDHPVYQPEHNLIWVIYGDKSAAFSAFESENLEIFNGVPPSMFERAMDEMDFAEETSVEGIQPFGLWPQMPEAPMKFPEFRDALGKVIDRREANQVVMLGESEPVAEPIPFSQNHPWHPGDVEAFTDDMTGDEEAAREVLRDAGWGWDSDGRLHYPPGADLSPEWEPGETPDPEDYPCIE